MSNKIFTAIEFASRKHMGQERKNGSGPYIIHPMAVMYILRDCNVRDDEILIAAVLHDTVEDTNTDLDEIKELFGEAVAKYVEEVTDDKSLPKAERKRLQIEHAKEISTGAKIIKLADKLHNLDSFTRGIPAGWSPKRVKGYFAWSRAVAHAIKDSFDQRSRKLDYMTELMNRLNKTFEGAFRFEGEWHSCLPKGDYNAMLEEYLSEMAEVKD